MKILLVNPPITRHITDPLIGEAGNLPLGLCYIAAYLKEHSQEVGILDAMAEGVGNIERKGDWVRTGLSERLIRERLQELKPDLIGITTMFTTYAQDSHDIARLVKEVNNDIPVVFGGVHATACWDTVMSDKNVDIIIKGEGEETILELVQAIQDKIPFSNIVGAIVRVNNSIVNNADRPFIKNLDTLPFPARGLLPVDIYIKAARLVYSMRQPVMDIITSRGCPCRCVYCGIHVIWKHLWRGRSAANIADEIEDLISRYGIREFRFLDDSMSVDKKRMHDICDEIVRRKLDIKWTTPNGIALWTLDEDLLRKMKKSGCYRLTFGIESGNAATQQFIGKVLPFDKASGVIKACNRLGIWTLATFIIGFPYETREQIMETINFANKLDLDIVFYNVLMPFPGARVYEILKKENLLPAEHTPEFYASQTGVGGGYDTKYLKKEEIAELANYGYRSFARSRMLKFLNPFRVMSKVKSYEGLRYVFKLASGLREYRKGGFVTKSNPIEAI